MILSYLSSDLFGRTLFCGRVLSTVTAYLFTVNSVCLICLLQGSPLAVGGVNVRVPMCGHFSGHAGLGEISRTRWVLLANVSWVQRRKR